MQSNRIGAAIFAAPRCRFVLAVCFVVASSASPPSSTAATDLKAEWKDGLHVFAEDRSVDIAIGGFFQNDWTFQRGDDAFEEAFPDALSDGTEFRRARFVMKGVFHETTEFQAAYEFSEGENGLKDVYVGLRKLPGIGNVRVGHFKEPFSFEQLVSDTYATFLERPLGNAFAPSRNTGIMVHDGRDRFTWAAGVFRDADAFGNGSGGGKYNGTARVTGVVWDADEGRKLFHVGASGSVRNPAGDQVAYSARPETNLAPRVVGTGTLEATDALLFGGEAALILGPASFSAEAARASVESGNQLDPSFWSAHVSGSWMLTGESRPYVRKSGVFDRLRPARNFDGKGGPGAWELAVRWSKLDLEDGAVQGGILEDVTAGINWHLNPNVRVLSNYVHGDRVDAGAYDSFSMRFQTDF